MPEDTYMATKHASSRASIVGWALLLPSVVSALANVEDLVQLVERIAGIKLQPPSIPWWAWSATGLLGAAVLGQSLRLRLRHEPIRQAINLHLGPALENLAVLLSNAGGALVRSGPMGALARCALEDYEREINLHYRTLQVEITRRSFSSLVTPSRAEHLLACVLNAYEVAVYRLRDALLALHLDPAADGNYAPWKRHDSELLTAVRTLRSQSRYTRLSISLESSIWRDGVRNYI